MKVIVTGANSGVGKATATALAAAGNQVTIACRTVAKGLQAAAEMPGDVEVCHLDLADLASVRRFADSVDSVDVLVNNAGVLGLPLTRTPDGFEAHVGTNHLGHFALTCLLAGRIRDRIVVVASTAYAASRIHFDDLNWQRRRYSSWSAYGESKLANMLFVAELVRRGQTAYASDPGMTATDITRDGSPALRWIGRILAPQVAQSPLKGPDQPSRRSPPTCPTGRISPRGDPSISWANPNRRKCLPRRVIRTALAGSGNLSAELTGCDWPA